MSVAGWTLADHVEELRGKYHLKKKDFEAYREGSQYVIDYNETVIVDSRFANKKKRILLAQQENGDETVIKSVFKNEREARLSLQRYTAAEAIDEMDQKTSEVGNVVNVMHFEREQREMELKELKQENDRLEYQEQPSPDHVQAGKSVTMLENALDKALIKSETAKLISSRYEDILQHLKEESLNLPARLNSMEMALREQKRELRELRSMAHEAVESRDQTKQVLMEVEHRTMADKRYRDQELAATKKEVEKRKHESEKVDKRGQRALLLTDQHEGKVNLELQQKHDNQGKILTYEDAFQRIKEASHVTDLEDVIQRVVMQKETNLKLRNSVQELEHQSSRIKEEVSKHNRQYHDMKYSGDAQLSRGEALLEDTRNYVEQEDQRKQDIDKSLEKNGGCLINIKTGIHTLLDKLNEVKLRPPLHNYTRGDIFDQLDLSSKKIEQLLKDLNFGSPHEALNMGENVHTPKFQEFLESRLAAENIRIRLAESEVQLSEYDFDGQENEVLGRTDIKRMGQKMLDARQKPKKKKTKKK